MKVFAALVAYVVTGASAALYPYVLNQITASFYRPSFAPTLIYIQFLTVFGLVLGPYFGIASLMPGAPSIWREVSRLIERHISFPFIGGTMLSYFGALAGSAFIFGAGTNPGATILLSVYLTLAALATVIVILSNRRPTPPTAVPA